jgi:multicomponent Na+:H+ antiporter subunit B
VYKASTSPIVLLLSKTVAPYIMLFGMYVVFHGHYSPGGGFQGGAMMAASILLIRIAADENIHQLQFKRTMGMPLASIGVLIYFVIGLIPLCMGGNFLDYSYLPLPGMETAYIRSLGILGIEIGVGIAVMAVLVSIYDNLLEGNNA